MAQSTKRVCRDCGFFLPLAGSLGVMFGVCGNELSADGHIVDFEYGCGAHSDTPAPAGSGSPMYDPFDDGVLEVSEKPAEAPRGTNARNPPRKQPVEEPAAEEPAEASAGSTSRREPPTESTSDEPVEPS